MNGRIHAAVRGSALLLLVSAAVTVLLAAGLCTDSPVTAASAHTTAVSTRAAGTPTPTPPVGEWVLIERGDDVRTWVWQPSPSTVTPSRTPSPTPIILIVAPTACFNDAAFAADVTIRDNTSIGPGEPFEKIWRIENTGSCAWTTDYQLTFQTGSQLGAPSSIDVPQTASGDIVDISGSMYAPRAPGTYTGVWQMVDPRGNPFGQRLTVVIQVPDPNPPTPTPTPLPPPKQFSARLVRWWPNCGSTGVKGTIVEPDGSPVNGLRVRVWADGWDGSLSLVSGVGLSYGPGQWDVLLRQAQTGKFYVAVVDWQTGENSFVSVDSEVLALDFNYTLQNCQPDGDGHQWAEVEFIRNY